MKAPTAHRSLLPRVDGELMPVGPAGHAVPKSLCLEQPKVAWPVTRRCRLLIPDSLRLPDCAHLKRDNAHDGSAADHPLHRLPSHGTLCDASPEWRGYAESWGGNCEVASHQQGVRR